MRKNTPIPPKTACRTLQYRSRNERRTYKKTLPRVLATSRGQYRANVRLSVPVHKKRLYHAYLRLLVPGQYCANVCLSMQVLISTRTGTYKNTVLRILANSHTLTVPRKRASQHSGTHSSRRSKSQLLCFLHSNSPGDSGNEAHTDGHLNFHIMWD